jgi:uncharacterized protein YbjT (DUF2867 family)
MQPPLKILLFGATGTAGGSVLQVCLRSGAVGDLRVVVRRQLPATDSKLRVFVHDDYLRYDAVRAAFRDIDACFFCLGISATQVSEENAYRRITKDFAAAAAQTLREESPRAPFHYLSGQGAALTSRMMWARVKAEAEGALMKEFDATCWRPAFIDGASSQSAPRLWQWLRPAARLLSPMRGFYVSGEDIGRAMLQATALNIRGRIIENRELRELADAWAKRPSDILL